MGWLDFLKKKETEEEIKEIYAEDLDLLVADELKREEEKADKVRKNLDKQIRDFVSSLKNQVKVLESISLKERKEQERLKIIVLENLRTYTFHLKRLLSFLEGMDESMELSQCFMGIEKSLVNFKKSSSKSFSKATILIGTELEQTEEKIRTFSGNLKDIQKENRIILRKIEEKGPLLKLKKDLEGVKRIEREISEEILSLKKEKERFAEEKSKNKKEFEEFKKSSEFMALIKEKKREEKEIERFEKDVRRVKEKIDFKRLLKQFHEVEKNRELIRNYRQSFLDSLEKDENLEIIKMLDSSLREEVGEQIKKIKSKGEELKKKRGKSKAERRLAYFEKMAEKNDYEIRVKIEEEGRKLRRFLEKEEALQREITEKSRDILGNVRIVG